MKLNMNINLERFAALLMLVYGAVNLVKDQSFELAKGSDPGESMATGDHLS